MLFSIGTRVRFRHTGETGVITARLDEGMLQVRLDDDPEFEIPAFEEDLDRNLEAEHVLPGAKFVAGKKEPAPAPVPHVEVRSQYRILKPKGIQLGFEAVPEKDEVRRYKVWLINDTDAEYLVEFDLFAGDENLLGKDVKLNPASAQYLGDMLADDLNDAPEAEVLCTRVSTQGADEPIFKLIKIKPKLFFNHVITAPVLNMPVHHFTVLEANEKTTPKPTDGETDLKTWTKTQSRKPKAVADPQYIRHHSTHHPDEFAAFVPEIDLHIQNLTNGYARLDKSQILRIQLSHFESFLAKAYRLGVSHVFVIHGLGEGKLKDAIADSLRHKSEVAKFKNEYHPRYGYGATEVIFR